MKNENLLIEIFPDDIFNRNFITKLQTASRKIHENTLRGGANFILVSPEIAESIRIKITQIENRS